MRGFFILAFLLATIVVQSWANQSLSIDEIQKKVASAKSAEAKIDAQNQLCFAYIKAGRIDEAKELLQQNEVLATKGNYSLGLSDCLDNMGKIYETNYDYTNAMKVYNASMKVREKQNKDTYVATSKNNVGRVLLLQGEFEEAIKNLDKALAIRENNQNKRGAAETHQLLGDANIIKKRTGSAKEYYKRALDLNITLEDLDKASEIATKLGQIESDLGAYESALVYFRMSLDLNSSVENMPSIAKDYENMAQTYYAQEAVEEAVDANQVALNIWKDLGNKIGLATVYKNLAQCNVQLGKKEQVKKYLDKAIKELKDRSGSPETHQIYKAIAGIYESIGSYKEAYQFHNMYAVSKEAFFSKEKSKAILELTTKYESEFEAEKQEQMIAQLEVEQSTSKKVRTFLILLIGLIGTLAMTLYNSYRRKKKDNIALFDRNKKIQQQKFEIDAKNIELKEKNARLDVLNTKLVDEMAERESIEKSSFARDRFLAGMSHEMRTPMNAIVGLTHLLLEEAPRGNQVEHLRNLQFSANNLTVFINDILDFSKIEAGKLTLDSRRFAVKKIFDETFLRFKKPIENQGVGLNYEYDERIPEYLVGDPARFNQIINNLMSTSLQKTTEGAISLKVYLEEFNTKDVLLKVVLTDTGSGLSKTDLEKMFQTYKGQNGDAFEGYERSRMALAMAKRLVDLQNGKLNVDTIEGKGTTYTILIPSKQAENVVAAKVKNKNTKKSENLKNKSILVVEDNKINQLVVAKLLRNLGASIETVDNGKEAVEIISQQDFDLVLMDIQMPIMDGYKATAEIRNMKDPVKANVPIIALTASAFLSETEKAKLFGMNDHVGKPFGPDDLLEKIHLCMDVLQPRSSSKV